MTRALLDDDEVLLMVKLVAKASHVTSSCAWDRKIERSVSFVQASSFALFLLLSAFFRLFLVFSVLSFALQFVRLFLSASLVCSSFLSSSCTAVSPLTC